MRIKIRAATLRDGNALCDIHVSAIKSLGRSHYTEAEIESWSKGRRPAQYEKHIRDRKVVVAHCKSFPVEFGTLDLATAEIRQLYVRAEYARKQIGTKILEELLAMAKAAGLRELHCNSSLNAEAFYRTLGFQSEGKSKHRFRDGGEIDCVLMRKPLD